PGRQPTGEEYLHTLIAQGLLPLIELLSDLHATGLRPHVALACSPLLTAQLSDAVVRKHFIMWIEALLAQHAAALEEAEAAGDSHAAYLERFYLEWGRRRLRAFDERFGRDLSEKLRELANAGVIEPLAGPASHAYLPLLGREESIRAQIEHGVLHTARHIGRPHGLWLPGCGWRPGLEASIADAGLRYVVIDPSSLPDGLTPAPIWVITHRLAAICPDESLARHIWSDELGYPGDPLYRDPEAPAGYLARSGAPYDPYHALRRAQEHGTHFAMSLLAEAKRRPHDELTLILLDIAQIGPQWVEGTTWLQAVLTHCATHGGIQLTTPGAHLRQHRPRVTAVLGASSWAAGGDGGWQGAEAEEYWQAIHAAEAQMVQLAIAHPSAQGERERILNQAARELLLAQTSDWPALLSAGIGDEFGAGRWRIYLTRFSQLAAIIHRGRINEADRFFLEQVEEDDGPFPHLNYRIFCT
ncbi:MAG: DUF1957 domain-containing protein, partial [Candidatus Viridilinea halotolerans]